MPPLFGRTVRKRQLIQRLAADTFTCIARKYQISAGDFPSELRMREQLKHLDFSSFHSYNAKMFESIERMLSEDVSRLMSMIPKDEELCREVCDVTLATTVVYSISDVIRSFIHSWTTSSHYHSYHTSLISLILLALHKYMVNALIQ